MKPGIAAVVVRKDKVTTVGHRPGRNVENHKSNKNHTKITLTN